MALLSAPQAFFGLALDGKVLALIVIILSVTAWITAFQRIAFVYAATTRSDAQAREPESDSAREPAGRDKAAFVHAPAGPILKGEKVS